MSESFIKFLFLENFSTIIPERLDAFINKYAELTHDKWAFEKVSTLLSTFHSFLNSIVG